MKFVNIMGPCSDIGRVKEKYIFKYDIQFEDAVKEVGSADKNIGHYSMSNPLIDALREIEHQAYLVKVDENFSDLTMEKEEALVLISNIKNSISDSFTKIENLKSEKKHLNELNTQINPFISIDFSIEKLLKFSFIKYRFGCIPLSSYRQFETYLYNHSELLFVKSYVDKEYVWGVYFVPSTVHEKVDAIFSSLYFKRVMISDELKATPSEEYSNSNERIEAIDIEIKRLEKEDSDKLDERKAEISAALKVIRQNYNYFEMQKYVAKTKDDFYIIVGWMTSQDALSLSKDTEDDKDIIVMVEDESTGVTSKPPTNLKNLLLFTPFEFFVKMYALPDYNEIDPTAFFAITYTILFGLMFGDLGQGIVLSLLGFLYYKLKKSQLGGIFAILGISSSVFGILYGSVFGFEHIIKPIWMNPMENMNTILIATVSFGIFLNLSAMCIQMINAFKRKDYGNLLFSSNGLSGFIFYSLVIYLGVCTLLKIALPPTFIIVFLLFIPLILIMFKEPFSNMMKKEKKLIHGSVGEYLMEAVFETFEVLLSYLTTTISFVRVGAFALCHAGMMSVVLMLAGTTSQNSGNIFIIIFGNLFVMLLEGLIVSIQVLRLQYYEMFSRFFTGGGKEFISFRKNK